MTAAASSQETPLKVGAVVRLRGRLWRVDRVERDEFAATPLDGPDTWRWRFHRAFEEPLIEPASMPRPDPHQLGDPADQDLFLRSLRLGMIHAGAPFLGLQRSRATPETYQLAPLLMALGMERVRLLIGDDVGIGKTIEAGLILAEMLARGLVERTLVVVPAALRDQWQDTLERFFHIDAVVIRGKTRPALERALMPGQSPWGAYPFVVTSVDYAKVRKAEILSHRWDMVIFDEVHLCARPHVQEGQSEPEMQRWEFLREVSRHERVRHLMLLSATPHNGHSDSWASLVEALDPTLVHGTRVMRDLAIENVVQRRRKDIQDWYGASSPFPKRETHPPEVITLGKSEVHLMSTLRSLTDRLEGSTRSPIGRWVSLHLQRRALSSPRSIQLSLKRRLQALDNPKPVSVERQRDAEQVVLDLDGEHSDEERYSRLDAAGADRTTERELIEEALKAANKVTPGRDGKLKRLLALLPKRAGQHPAARRVLVFTRYKDTLDYLADALRKESKRKGSLLKGYGIITISGDLSQVARRERYRTFQAEPEAICVATDCISEGLDLQRGCAELIHYELPWNPNRLEQRNGRIDRYGQPEGRVGITTLVREDPLDVTVLEVIFRKAKEIRDEFGFCPVFFSSSSDLRSLIATYGKRRDQLSLFGTEQLPDPFDRDRMARVVDDSFYGQSQVRLPQVQQALERTYHQVGNPQQVEAFVRSALDKLRAEVEPDMEGRVSIRLAGTALQDLGEELVCTFDPRVGRDDPDLTVIDLSQPLVRRLVEEVQQDHAGTPRGRVAARGTAEVSEMTAVVQLLVRFVANTEPPLLMEELVPVAVPVYGDGSITADPSMLLHAKPSPHPFTSRELVEAIKDAFANPAFEINIDQAMHERREALSMRQQEVADTGLAWAAGSADLRIASRDIVSITLLVPAEA